MDDTTVATERLQQFLRAAAEGADPDHQRLLRRLANTTANMTPAEKTWVEEASDEELRGFARAIRMGCARDSDA